MIRKIVRNDILNIFELNKSLKIDFSLRFNLKKRRKKLKLKAV